MTSVNIPSGESNITNNLVEIRTNFRRREFHQTYGVKTMVYTHGTCIIPPEPEIMVSPVSGSSGETVGRWL